MSPANFHEDDRHTVARKEAHQTIMNGPRPSPLRINKDSLVIHKPHSSNSSFVANNNHLHHQQQQQRSPVIIYTHSPKIIHTQARDFMALVQKLTGLTPSDHENDHENATKTSPSRKGDNDREMEDRGGMQNEYISSGDQKLCSVSPMFNSNKTCFADMPLFTPSWNDLFCSPRPLFRYNDKVSPSKNMVNSSNLEVVKGLPDY